MIRSRTIASAFVATIGTGAAAHAQDPPEENLEPEAVLVDPERPTLAPSPGYREEITPEEETRGFGYALEVGGGLGGFAGPALRDSVAGSWHLRGILGSRSRFGAELSYLGSAQGMGGTERFPAGSRLVSHGGQAALRMSVNEGKSYQPFVVAGLAVRRYSLDMDVGDSRIDNVVEFPFGVGVAFRRGDLIGEMRGEYRMAGEDGLLDAGDDMQGGTLERWAVLASVGYEL